MGTVFTLVIHFFPFNLHCHLFGGLTQALLLRLQHCCNGYGLTYKSIVEGKCNERSCTLICFFVASVGGSTGFAVGLGLGLAVGFS